MGFYHSCGRDEENMWTDMDSEVLWQAASRRSHLGEQWENLHVCAKKSGMSSSEHHGKGVLL